MLVRESWMPYFDRSVECIYITVFFSVYIVDFGVHVYQLGFVSKMYNQLSWSFLTEETVEKCGNVCLGMAFTTLS